MMALSATAVATFLYGIAKRGRNLKRFGDRQQLYLDLHRFSVTIVTAFAFYLLSTRASFWELFPLPDTLLLFATTALPTLLLCLLSARWFLGYPASLLVQWSVLAYDGQTYFFLPAALLSLAGLVLYLLIQLIHRRNVQTRSDQRALAQYQARHDRST